MSHISPRVLSVGGRASRWSWELTPWRYQFLTFQLELSDDEIFAAYIGEMTAVYAQTEEVLRSGGLDPTEANWDEPTKAFISDPGTGYFLYRGKLTLPFEFGASCHSRWFKAPLHHRKESRQLYQDVDDPVNIVALKFRITTNVSSDRTSSVMQRLVLRRYQERDRMVVVWRLFTEGERLFKGMHADETGWGIVTPVKSSSKTGTTTYVRNVPMHLNTSATHGPVVRHFAGKLAEWGSENNQNVTLGLIFPRWTRR